jgi:hypothetical protein
LINFSPAGAVKTTTQSSQNAQQHRIIVAFDRVEWLK